MEKPWAYHQLNPAVLTLLSILQQKSQLNVSLLFVLCGVSLLVISVAYAEKFHGGFHLVAYGGHLHLVSAVCDIII